MELIIISSGSQGNCYKITSKSGKQIMLDCGLKLEKISPFFDFTQLDFCLITHKHQDHCKAQKELEDIGIEIFSCDNLEVGKPIDYEEWRVVPFPLKHGEEKCFGYMIYNKIEKKTILYATDFEYFERDIAMKQAFDLVLIECNYSKKIVFEKASKGDELHSHYYNHQSMESLLEWFKSRPVKDKVVIPCHISNSGLLDVEEAEKFLSGCGEFVKMAKNDMRVVF